jgi:hypothetical protein
VANLFTSQTPAITDASDGAPGIATATTVRFTQSGTVTGIRFYATATVSGTYTAELYQVTAADVPTPAGTLLASQVAGTAPTGGTWNTITFGTPVDVVTGTLYRAVIHSGAGRYVATLSFFGSDLTNGDIIADANGDDPVGLGTLRNGTFAISATTTYPGGGGNTCYFVDVEFTAGSVPDTVAPDSIALIVTPGQPTVDATLTTTPGSIQMIAAVGQPTVTTPAPAPDATTSGWNGLLAVRRSADADHRFNVERERNPVDCPDHGWPLTKTDRGLHCEFGGHVVTPRSY